MTEPGAIQIMEVELDAAVGQALLDLNNAHAVELSWLHAERLQHLVREAYVALRVGKAEAFLLAFDQSADYDSPNFLWFRSRVPRFVYVDRVVVAANSRGQGVARRMYDQLFGIAGRAGHDQIVCEVNCDPPNSGSDALHATLGFSEMGVGVLNGGHKTVRYLARPLGQRA